MRMVCICNMYTVCGMFFAVHVVYVPVVGYDV